MKNVYEDCPVLENETYQLRLVNKEDLNDLYEVYSDEKAVPFFNGDNCDGDDFHYKTIERMQQAIDFWIFSYDRGYFVRWAIIDKNKNRAIGTIELFHRESKDFFDQVGLLRLDLHSSYETADDIQSILSIILEETYQLFDCKNIVTKAIESAKERRKALKSLGFSESKEKLVGNDGTEYGDYFIK